MKSVVRIPVYESQECCIIKFPDREVFALGRTAVANLVRDYAKEHGVVATIHWETKSRARERSNEK